MNDDSRSWDFVAGFLLGAMVGAAAALLLAPSSGEEMRDTLKEKGIELKGRGDEMTEDARRRAAEAQERGRLALEEQKAKLQEAIDAGKQAATQRQQDLLNRFQAEKTAPAGNNNAATSDSNA